MRIKVTGPWGLWKFPILSRLLRLDEESSSHKCWSCGESFFVTQAQFCDSCSSYVCPHCGTHYCSLNEDVKRALDAEMSSYGFWDLSINPPKRKRKAKRFEFPDTASYLSWLERFYPDLYSSYAAGTMTLSDTMTEVYRRTDRYVLISPL